MIRALVAVPLVAACFSQPPAPDQMNPNAPARRLAAGGKHACFIADTDVMYCWGDNTYGQLGVPASVMPYSATPVPVGGDNPIDGWKDIAAGDHHTCGILAGAVVCFGADDRHQTQGDSAPHQIALPGGTPARVFAGSSGTCMLDDAGALYCWGRVDQTAGNFASPTQLMPTGVASPWSEIAIADDHACAIRGDFGSAWCWGKDDQMQLGTADLVSHSAADAQVVQGGSYAHVAVDFETSCGIDIHGTLACWGGVAATGDAPTPYLAIDDSATTGRMWSALAVESGHVCAIANGGVYCYGDDSTGDLGHGEFAGAADVGSPVMPSAAEVAIGTGFSCASDTGDVVFCWGANIYGELGAGTVATARDPFKVDLGGAPAYDVVVGYGHTCALLQDGEAYCWGDNRKGQAVPGGAMNVTSPQLAISGIDRIAVGAHHTCGRDGVNKARVRCWGDDSSGQAPPATVLLAGTADALAAGGDASCAVVGGTTTCWGNVPGDPGGPHVVTTATNAIDIAVGGGFAGIVNMPSATSLLEWGNECSLGTTTVPPSGAVNRTDVSLPTVVLSQGGSGHGCAAASTQLTCWGANDHSQVYPQPSACEVTPVPVAPPSGDVWTGRVAVGGDHTCAIGAIGKVYCWGDNSTLALGGDVPPAVVTMPSEVGQAAFANGVTGWNSIVTGPQHTCALAPPNNDVWCWGLNWFGEVGNGQSFQPAPGPRVQIP